MCTSCAKSFYSVYVSEQIPLIYSYHLKLSARIYIGRTGSDSNCIDEREPSFTHYSIRHASFVCPCFEPNDAAALFAEHRQPESIQGLTSSEFLSAIEAIGHASRVDFHVLHIALTRVGDPNVYPLVYVYLVFLLSGVGLSALWKEKKEKPRS